jgi:hypothetical protein
MIINFERIIPLVETLESKPFFAISCSHMDVKLTTVVNNHQDNQYFKIIGLA